MNDKKIMTLELEDGTEQEYEILVAYKWTKTGKNYIVYTDNSKDEEGSLNIYAAIYYPNDDSKLDSVETDEEWEEVNRRVNNLNKEGVINV